MTEKEKQAKLQYLLNSLSMTKEQKDIVVDLVNSSGSGSGGQSEEKIVLTVDVDNQKIQFLDVEYTSTVNIRTTQNNTGICEISNAELKKLISDYYKNNNPVNRIKFFWLSIGVNCTVLSSFINPVTTNISFIIFLETPINIEFID